MHKPSLLVIVQARMGSNRLPGKVLREVCGKTILQLMLERLGKYGTAEHVLVATSVLPADDVLVAACEKQEIPFFRGDESDVLGRFYNAAIHSGAHAETVIVRICADSPLHHEAVVDFALEQFHTHQLDYFSNAVPPKYEDGITTEVFRFAALEKA
ncbi:MAG: cytidylyltransferase domain-containing protein, partial [Bacteroidia bacterium]